MWQSSSNALTREMFIPGKSSVQVPVLIVGAGPTGLCTSLLLSRYGIPSLLVERHASTSIYPRATGVSTRSMELFRQWGLDQRVKAAGFELEDASAPVSLTLAQPELTRLPLGFPSAQEVAAVSPVTPCACPQDALEPLLLERARSYAEAQVVFGTELTTIEQDGAGIRATIIDRSTENATLVEAHYVVAADGAHSRVREHLGIAMQGPDQLGNYLSVLFRADLNRLIKSHVHGLYFIQHPEASGIFVPTSTDGRWVFAMEWHPERGERLEDYDSERCIRLVRTATGVPDLDVELLGVQAFPFAAQVAQCYRKGNVFLAGDAAHRMTPSGGTGMNTGIHDAHNLAWKLAAVLKGWADTTLLETYESERRPVGLHNTRRSNTRRVMGEHEEDEESWSDLEIDLGYCYESKVIIPDPAAEEVGTAPARSRLTCRPGRRAPHVWLTRGGKRISTLDLYDQTLTLVTGSAGTSWCEAADRVARAHGVPLVAHLIGPEGELGDGDSHWDETYKVEADGALLIRPDGFVAWRKPGMVRDPQTELHHVVDQIVGHSPS